MKSKLLCFILLLFSILGFAQNVEIKGRVLDANSGLPLPGVNVSVKSSKQGTSSDFDGNFKINVPKGSKLSFTYVGYLLKEITANENETITVKLLEDKKTLDEVVLVGYSSKKKKDVTGAVAVVTSKTIEELSPIKAEQALQGTVAGVQVSAGSGAPGAGLNIRIRGISSNDLSGPMVLIDGYRGQMELLNPNDIESFTVLKDAQASIYGAEGANGVILVTTKQGKKNQKPKVSFNSYAGMQQTTRKLPVLNATNYALLLNESYANGGQALPYPNVSNLGQGTDWQDEVFKDAFMFNNDIAVSGGSEKITYSFSGQNIRQDGIVGLDKSGFDRSTVRTALTADISDKLKLQTNFMYTDFNRKSLSEGGLGSVLYNTINIPSVFTPYDANGDFTQVPSTPGYGNEIINPLAQIENTYNDYNLKKLSGTMRLDFMPIKGMKLTTRYGFNSSNSNSKVFNKQIDYGSSKVFNVTRSSVTQSKVEENDYTFDIFAEYERKFFKDHRIKAMIGSTAWQYKYNVLGATGYDIPYNSWDYADISLATGISGTGLKDSYTGYNYIRKFSYFSTLDYDYKGRYFLSGIYRNDSSSRFGPNKRSDDFFSVLGSWIISDEAFFKENKYVNFLKLRASYGELGNDNISTNNDYRSLLNGQGTYVFNNTLTTVVALGKIANTDIQWETGVKKDLGLDMRMFNNKLDITADYYIDTKENLLIPNVPVSGINGGTAPGSSNPTVNAGTIRNSGFELLLKYSDKLSDNFKYNFSFNMTTIKNEVLRVDNGIGKIYDGSFGVGNNGVTSMAVGQSIGAMYGYEAIGVFQNQAEVNAAPSQFALGANASPGDIRFKDVNGDGVIDLNDKTYIGNAIPDYTIGFNLGFNYKNFDFLTYAYANVGNDMIRNYERTENKLNRMNYVLDRWTGEGTSNSVPRVTTGTTTNNVFSSYFVEDASFLRIQNVQLGYTIPGLEKSGITKLRIYTSVNNIYTFTKYRGFDPAANSGNSITGSIDNGFYPSPRIYMLGINVNF